MFTYKESTHIQFLWFVNKQKFILFRFRIGPLIVFNTKILDFAFRKKLNVVQFQCQTYFEKKRL